MNSRILLIAFVLGTLRGAVEARPQYLSNDKAKCYRYTNFGQPEKKFGFETDNHSNPSMMGRHANPSEGTGNCEVSITYQGSEVSTYSPGKSYDVAITSGGNGHGLVYVHSHGNVPDGDGSNCNYPSKEKVDAHSFVWEMPDEPSGDVGISVICSTYYSNPKAYATTKFLSEAPSPTQNPTAEPTKNPTGTPTAIPTASPTQNPTAEPTKNPTGTPTARTTSSPTQNPTAEPTKNPTGTPTARTTSSPTQNPTAEPTNIPTPLPTANSKPNDGKSCWNQCQKANKGVGGGYCPDFCGEEQYCCRKGQSGSWNDGCRGQGHPGGHRCFTVDRNQATGTPTTSPTDEPTNSPTDMPTHSPTDMPTQGEYPTSYPTSPTYGPTDIPTSTPTDYPTSYPTGAPTIAVVATASPVVPTSYPTSYPTEAPTIAVVATDSPVVYPTHFPTSSPTLSLDCTFPTNGRECKDIFHPDGCRNWPGCRWVDVNRGMCWRKVECQTATRAPTTLSPTSYPTSYPTDKLD